MQSSQWKVSIVLQRTCWVCLFRLWGSLVLGCGHDRVDHSSDSAAIAQGDLRDYRNYFRGCPSGLANQFKAFRALTGPPDTSFCSVENPGDADLIYRKVFRNVVVHARKKGAFGLDVWIPADSDQGEGDAINNFVSNFEEMRRFFELQTVRLSQVADGVGYPRFEQEQSSIVQIRRYFGVPTFTYRWGGLLLSTTSICDEVPVSITGCDKGDQLSQVSQLAILPRNRNTLQEQRLTWPPALLQQEFPFEKIQEAEQLSYGHQTRIDRLAERWKRHDFQDIKDAWAVRSHKAWVGGLVWVILLNDNTKVIWKRKNSVLEAAAYRIRHLFPGLLPAAALVRFDFDKEARTETIENLETLVAPAKENLLNAMDEQEGLILEFVPGRVHPEGADAAAFSISGWRHALFDYLTMNWDQNNYRNSLLLDDGRVVPIDIEFMAIVASESYILDLVKNNKYRKVAENTNYAFSGYYKRLALSELVAPALILEEVRRILSNEGNRRFSEWLSDLRSSFSGDAIITGGIVENSEFARCSLMGRARLFLNRQGRFPLPEEASEVLFKCFSDHNWWRSGFSE